jgi:hypothetical protein
MLSYAMMGDYRKAEALSEGFVKLTDYPSFGSSQAWALYAADGYAMLGNLLEAERQGRCGTSGENSALHTESYAGPYARWVARISLAERNVNSGHERLDKLLLNLGSYDAIDQAEVLNAKAWFSAHTNSINEEYLERMYSHLERLPDAVGDQLRRMGMMDFC